jgi:hypothetical protein
MFVVSYERWLRAQETDKKYWDATRTNIFNVPSNG